MATSTEVSHRYPFEAPISLVYKPSFIVFVAVTCVYVGIFFTLATTALPIYVYIACHLLLSVSLMQHIRQFIKLQKKPRVILHLSSSDEWYLYQATEKIRLTMQRDILVHHQLIVLNFIDPNRKRHDFILLKENTDAEQFRLLRVRLRHGLHK